MYLGSFNAGRGLLFSSGYFLRSNLFLQPYGDQVSLSACSAFKSLALFCDWFWLALPKKFSTAARLDACRWCDTVWLMKLRCVNSSCARDRYMALALASQSPSCYRIHRTCFLPGDFVPQCCIGTERHRFVMLNMTLFHLSLPLRYFQAFILSSDYFSSSSHFQRCSLLLLLFSSAVIAVSPSPIYLLLLVVETTVWNHTANKNPFSPGRPILTGRNRRTSVAPPSQEEEREGLCLLPLAAFPLFIFGEGLWSLRHSVGQSPAGQRAGSLHAVYLCQRDCWNATWLPSNTASTPKD